MTRHDCSCQIVSVLTDQATPTANVGMQQVCQYAQCGMTLYLPAESTRHSKLVNGNLTVAFYLLLEPFREGFLGVVL